jgi:beta-lactamase superfamily II metal-dependent hydrolase
MSDFYEIDFLAVESKKSGDAITIRYKINDVTRIHVVDGGFQSTGEKVTEHIKKHYDNPIFIDYVVATHQDGDHAGGLRTVLEKFAIGELWMLRPWLYADELISRFSRFTNVENLKQRLKEIYPNIAALEVIALERGIAIREPFQGSTIGAFTVLSPTKARYLDLIVESDKTPDSIKENTSQNALARIFETAKALSNLIRSAWGKEIFSTNGTSAENEMSIVQYANIANRKILLTADTGRDGLNEAANFAPFVNLQLPGIDFFQVPHHGSRRNVSTEILNRWLGNVLPFQPSDESAKFSAFISSAKEDLDHPRNAVVRAMQHRGGNVSKTEGQDIRHAINAPIRVGWGPINPTPYPVDQEE